jgi:glucose-6-phosphate isomerase
MSKLTHSPAWQELGEHYNMMRSQHMRQMFQDDAARFKKFTVRLDSLLFDYSKNRINEETVRLLVNLAEQAELPAYIERMFTGEKINSTEGRAALHTALRNRSAGWKRCHAGCATRARLDASLQRCGA